MANKTLSKNFFLISFLPAIAYWYLEENYPVMIAVTGGMILATIEVLFEKIYFKHVQHLKSYYTRQYMINENISFDKYIVNNKIESSHLMD